jgi:hypothetical protein
MSPVAAPMNTSGRTPERSNRPTLPTGATVGTVRPRGSTPYGPSSGRKKTPPIFSIGEAIPMFVPPPSVQRRTRSGCGAPEPTGGIVTSPRSTSVYAGEAAATIGPRTAGAIDATWPALASAASCAMPCGTTSAASDHASACDAPRFASVKTRNRPR